MSDHVVRRTIDGLSQVPGTAAHEADQLKEQIDRLSKNLTGALGAERDAGLSALGNEIEALVGGMFTAVDTFSSDVEASVEREVGELRRLLEPAGTDPRETAGAPSSRATGRIAPTQQVGHDVRRVLGESHPDVAGLLVRLTADREHPLDLTRALTDPQRRETTLAIVAQLADEATLAGRALELYRRDNPGRGRLFERPPSEVDADECGAARKDLYIAHGKSLDAARRVGEISQPADEDLLRHYVRRLRREVAPYVRRELESITQGVEGAALSLRVKDLGALADKVDRMTQGSHGRPARPDYRVGDIVDAVGARIVVDDTDQLATLMSVVERRYGVGGSGRILEMENMYVAPKSHNPAYRVVPFVVAVDLGGLPYVYELQLCTRRASVAADLEHNTVYKRYVTTNSKERSRVRRMQAEAAALDQEETRQVRS